MHNNRKDRNIARKLLFALALIIFFGCQKEAIDPNDDNRPNADGSVGFRLVNETEDIQVKGTPQKNLDNYSSVQVNVYSHKEDYSASNSDTKLYREIELEQNNGKWKYEPPMYWPTGHKMSFISYASDIDFAQAGITFTPKTGAAESITYKVPTEVAKQPDLLVSTKFNQQEIPNILLNMKHALTCVSFSGVAPEEGTYVKKITLRNVCGEGTLKLNDPTMKWQVNKDSYGVTVFEPGIDKDQELGEAPLQDNNYLMSADGYLMMVPQKLENAAIDVHYWDGKDDKKDSIVTYILPVDKEEYATWQPGKSYIYRFGNQGDSDITVVYYERYTDGYGLYYYENGNVVKTLDETGTKEILEAGYGVLTKEKPDNVLPIRISSPVAAPVTSGAVVELSTSSYLYPIDQSAANTFPLSKSTIPASIYFNGSSKSCGMIIPHFAKGVYTSKIAVASHTIRTPQQMRNITSIGTSMIRGSNIYTQELNLDFSKTSIGGGDLVSSIVDCDFNDIFDGKGKKIENVNINAITSNGALFLLNGGVIKDLKLMNPHIITSGNCGGIAAENKKDGEITRVRVIGDIEATPFLIQGSAYVGAITGLNSGKITGNPEIEVATEITVAEVAGWGTVRGSAQATGGIAGNNIGTISTCLVNGVHVTGPALGNAKVAKITIVSAGNYVGGIAGSNSGVIDGNYSVIPGGTKAEPDIAGLVSVSGVNFIGGIAGNNKGALNRVNIRLGRGDATKAITISGQQSVGGIVGYNESKGVLGADATSFISVRGNVIISGTDNVGGIVGNNQDGNITNCFVFNFYSQTDVLTHYAPKIKGVNKVGGIVGLAGTGNITKCSVFSTVSNANKGNGDATLAVTEITATGASVGGIVGHGISGININSSFVLGNVNIKGVNNCGGIMGENDPKTSVTSVHIGNSGQEISDIYTQLFKVLKLPVDDPRMQTGGGAMTSTSGTPTISGATYVGGICGVNWGAVKDILLKDNIIIGSSTSDWVGGISGGNGLEATISSCKVYNPAGASSVVKILGRGTIGGITGVNNGIVELCQLGLPVRGASRLIEIKGSWSVGGIVGINGGNEKYVVEDTVSKKAIPGTGNDNTRITDCNVYGKVTIEATSDRVGGIIGQNGITNKIVNCNVIGYESSYTNPTTHTHDITLKADASVGGIAGYNYGEIYGTSAAKSSTVTHTAIIGNGGYSGGLVGVMKAVKTGDKKNTPFESKLYYCDVSYGVLVYFLRIRSGAFAGLLDGIGGDNSKPTLFGTVASSRTNRIYTGTTNRVVIDGNGTLVKPQSSFPLPYWEKPDVEHTLGNLWVYYQMGNYLHYTTYQ